MASSEAHTDAFNALVEHLRRTVARRPGSMGRGEGSDACDAEGGASGAAAKPSWEWTCLALVRLLQQFPAGVSAAVMETQLVSQWQS